MELRAVIVECSTAFTGMCKLCEHCRTFLARQLQQQSGVSPGCCTSRGHGPTWPRRRRDVPGPSLQTLQSPWSHSRWMPLPGGRARCPQGPQTTAPGSPRIAAQPGCVQPSQWAARPVPCQTAHQGWLVAEAWQRFLSAISAFHLALFHAGIFPLVFLLLSPW